MSSSLTIRLPLSLMAALLLTMAQTTSAAENPALPSLTVTASLAAAKEVLQEVIQEEGLLPGQVARVGDMLARTGPALGKTRKVFAEAEVVQFCSARDAWQMTEENPDQLAYCPLAISLYTLADSPDVVHIVYRSPGSDSPARAQVAVLLGRIAAAVRQRLQQR